MSGETNWWDGYNRLDLNGDAFTEWAREVVPELLYEVDSLRLALGVHTRTVTDLRGERDEAAEKLRDLIARLGHGDGITEPQAEPEHVIADARATEVAARDWWESQTWRYHCLEAGHPDDEDCYVHDPARRLERAEAELAAARADLAWLEGWHYSGPDGLRDLHAQVRAQEPVITAALAACRACDEGEVGRAFSALSEAVAAYGQVQRETEPADGWCAVNIIDGMEFYPCNKQRPCPEHDAATVCRQCGCLKPTKPCPVCNPGATP